MHGFPQNGKVGDPNYVPYVTKAMVRHAHRNGIKVVPWTIDDPATMHKLIDDGVDGIITDYPDRLRTVAAERGYRLPAGVRVAAGHPGRTAAHGRCGRRTRSPRSGTRWPTRTCPRWSWTPASARTATSS